MYPYIDTKELLFRKSEKIAKHEVELAFNFYNIRMKKHFLYKTVRFWDFAFQLNKEIHKSMFFP